MKRLSHNNNKKKKGKLSVQRLMQHWTSLKKTHTHTHTQQAWHDASGLCCLSYDYNDEWWITSRAVHCRFTGKVNAITSNFIIQEERWKCNEHVDTSQPVLMQYVTGSFQVGMSIVLTLGVWHVKNTMNLTDRNNCTKVHYIILIVVTSASDGK